MPCPVDAPAGLSRSKFLAAAGKPWELQVWGIQAYQSAMKAVSHENAIVLNIVTTHDCMTSPTSQECLLNMAPLQVHDIASLDLHLQTLQNSCMASWYCKSLQYRVWCAVRWESSLQHWGSFCSGFRGACSLQDRVQWQALPPAPPLARLQPHLGLSRSCCRCDSSQACTCIRMALNYHALHHDTCACIGFVNQIISMTSMPLSH